MPARGRPATPLVGPHLAHTGGVGGFPTALTTADRDGQERTVDWIAVDLDWLGALMRPASPPTRAPAAQIPTPMDQYDRRDNRRGAPLSACRLCQWRGAALAKGEKRSTRSGAQLDQTESSGFRPVNCIKVNGIQTERCPHPSHDGRDGGSRRVRSGAGTVLKTRNLRPGKIRATFSAISRPFAFLTVKTRTPPPLGKMPAGVCIGKRESGDQAPEPTSTNTADRTPVILNGLQG